MEGDDRQIQSRFSELRALLAEYGARASGERRSAVEELRRELELLESRYALSTAHLHIMGTQGEVARAEAEQTFRQVLHSGDYLGELERLARRFQRALSKADQRRADGRVRFLLSEMGGSGRLGCEHSDHVLCEDCDRPMEARDDNSELQCPECGRVRSLLGTVFTDNQYYSQEGQRPKSGNFNPSRHCTHWLTRILAREPEGEIGTRDDPNGAALVQRMREQVQHQGKVLHFLTIEDVRAMLRSMNRADLYKNAPLILKRLTGIGPPSIPPLLQNRVVMLFAAVIQTRERVCRGAPNRKYYPFYLYKIFDWILDEKDEESRRVLDYIHIQGSETVQVNDKEWRTICENLPGELQIEWSPTMPH